MKTNNKFIYGIGMNDNIFPVHINGSLIKSYVQWRSMLCRCYDPKFHLKEPSYIGCTVCEEWLLFSNFKKWFDKNYIKGYDLDKDILFKGNKIYSPETCCFVPHKINTLFIKNDKDRGKFPIGICLDKNAKKIRAQININRKVKYLGIFNTIEEAFNVYKIAKEDYISEIAEEYYGKSLISENVYHAMLNYKVEITD